MKYDRPVSELLDECAHSLREPFTRQDILLWFRQHYPDVKPNTVQTHIFALTDGDAPSRDYYNVGGRRPVLERVGRGLYQRARGGARQGAVADKEPMHLLTAPKPHAIPRPVGDVLLVGCVKSKRPQAAPARDLYTSTLFARRRRYAERSGARWFVVSSRWGLVTPEEVIAPYDVFLGDMPASYRRAWAAFVVAQLAGHLELAGASIEIHAGDHYVDALRPAIEGAGAELIDPVDAHSMGETLAWYDIHVPVEQPSHATATVAVDDVDALVTALLDISTALTPADLPERGRRSLASPGLYTWWVDDVGAGDLTHGFGHGVAAGLLYAGQAGATRWPSGRRSSNTLWGRLAGMHLGGRSGLSTFRLSLFAVLSGACGADLDEAGLTSWMGDHLRVIPVPVADADGLGRVEELVLRRLDPPFNLRGMEPTPVRIDLRRLRREVTEDD